MDKNFEVICAVGRVSKIGRPVVIFAAYIPPSIRVADFRRLQEQLATEIAAVRTSFKNPAVLLAGDFNHRDVLGAVNDVAEFEQIATGPTRGNSTIDVILSNVKHLHSETIVLPPLQASSGAMSDHRCVYTEVLFPRSRGYEWVVKMRRTRDQAREEAFVSDMGRVDWKQQLEGLDPDQMSVRLEEVVRRLTDKNFPLVRVRKRSNEAPWITRAIKRLWKRKIRLYKKGGRSQAWWETDAELQRRIGESRINFVDKILEEGCNGGSFYAASKKLSTATSSSEWRVQDLFNGRPPAEICDEILGFYGKISGTRMAPMPEVPRVDGGLGTFTIERTVELLGAAKKTESRVDGDPLAHMVRKYPGAFAEPVAAIYNEINRCGKWPAKWKTEHLTIIPKVPNPAGLHECRNISCTSIFSKVLEGVVLKQLRAELEPDPAQYGGTPR